MQTESLIAFPRLLQMACRCLSAIKIQIAQKNADQIIFAVLLSPHKELSIERRQNLQS